MQGDGRVHSFSEARAPAGCQQESAALQDNGSKSCQPEANSERVLAPNERRFGESAIIPMHGLSSRFLVPVAQW